MVNILLSRIYYLAHSREKHSTNQNYTFSNLSKWQEDERTPDEIDLRNQSKKRLALQKVLKVWEWEKVTKIKTVNAWRFRKLIFYEKYFGQNI